ncbi:aspartate ammonia-lyase [Sporolactobacillus terrae]|uniref:aspartate ammonia-lyase n=1 Tax=Sporolactobacillus terrae TaxID=269673 RepID=UPI0006877175|nr:aspartate ammonia-lyase [Sporolactobacillus terrae]
MRTETDALGTKEIPQSAYYGIHSLRAKENFSVAAETIDSELIHGLALIKKAAAIVNHEDGSLSNEKATAITRACDEILEGKFNQEFIAPAIQGSAGTSMNMNANEVIANRAIELLGGTKGDYTLVHPNDDINRCQSTNDVFPSASKLALLRLSKRLALEIDQFLDGLVQKADELKDVVKLGRTQLQDALPTTVGNTFQAFASAIARNLNELNHSRDALRTLNLGGTAIGTTVNASEYYVRRIVPEVSKQFGQPLRQADNLIDATQHVDAFVQLSHAYKLLAVTLSKMASDLRLLSSGPQFGYNELFLPKKQAGSSIMPGKVNPVIPELVNQVAFQIIGFDTTNTLAAEAGQLELNAFEPIIVRNLISASRLLQKTLRTFRINCINGIQANRAQCAKEANQCAILATALTPYIGYSKTCKLVKQSLEMDIPIQTLAAQLPDVPEQALKLLDPKTMIPFYKTQALKAN